MKNDHLFALLVVLWLWDEYNKSHQGISAFDSAYKKELSNFQALEGTNFTNSVWDPVSGQPSYQFGVIDAPGGDSVTGNQSASGVFGSI